MQRVLLRYFGYALAVATITALLILWADRAPGGLQFDRQVSGISARTSEFSPVEVLQNLLLVACGSILLWVAWHDRLRRPMMITLTALMATCLVRELDFFLDFYLIDNLWQVLCALLIAFSLVYGVRNRERFGQGWRRSWPSAGMAMILVGFILLIPFAQLIGHEALWRAVLGDGYIRVVKVAVEELLELGAYLIITIGTVEFVYAWSRLPRTGKRKIRT